MTTAKYAMLVLLSLLGAANVMLAFFSPPWYSPFIGTLLAISIPYWAAMVAVLHTKEHNDST